MDVYYDKNNNLAMEKLQLQIICTQGSSYFLEMNIIITTSPIT